MSLPPSLKSAMTPFPYSIDVKANLQEARALMEKHKVRHLPVLQGHTVVGIITERDIAARIGRPGDNFVSNDISVEEAYIEDVYVVDLNEPLDNVLQTMADRHIGSAIVTRDGRLAGVFTTVDACRIFADYLRKNFPHPDGDSVA